MWCGGLLWLVASAVVYRCDLRVMCRLIKLHTHGCVGSQIRLAGCVSIGKYVTQLTLLVWGWGGRMVLVSYSTLNYDAWSTTHQIFRC